MEVEQQGCVVVREKALYVTSKRMYPCIFDMLLHLLQHVVTEISYLFIKSSEKVVQTTRRTRTALKTTALQQMLLKPTQNA